MKIAIMQPTYLPWMGYFDLMQQVDTFVILDNVAFSKQSFHQRNRIKIKGDFLWLTIPVQSSGKMGQMLYDTKLSETKFLTKHFKSIETAYQKAPFYQTYRNQLQSLYQTLETAQNLIEVNLAFMHFLKNHFGIQTPFIHASSLQNLSSDKGARLIDIAKHLGASHYITPKGAVDYLTPEIPLFHEAGITVGVHNFEHPVYGQLYPPFISHLCALDLLFNEGNNARDVLLSGHRPPIPFQEYTL